MSTNSSEVELNSLPLEYTLDLVTHFLQIKYGRNDSVWLPKLGYKKVLWGFFPSSSLSGHLLWEKPAAKSKGHSRSPTERPIW